MSLILGGIFCRGWRGVGTESVSVEEKKGYGEAGMYRMVRMRSMSRCPVLRVAEEGRWSRAVPR